MLLHQIYYHKKKKRNRTQAKIFELVEILKSFKCVKLVCAVVWNRITSLQLSSKVEMHVRTSALFQQMPACNFICHSHLLEGAKKFGLVSPGLFSHEKVHGVKA